jgi:hypothetical protein
MKNVGTLTTKTMMQKWEEMIESIDMLFSQAAQIDKK